MVLCGDGVGLCGLDAVFASYARKGSFQLGPCPVQAGHYRTHRNIQDLRDLFVVKLVDIGEKHDRTIMFGQLCKCL